jgi:hypothetical protein
MKKIPKEHVWLTFIVAGPILAYFALFYPGLIMVSAAFIIIGLKGVLGDVM